MIGLDALKNAPPAALLLNHPATLANSTAKESWLTYMITTRRAWVMFGLVVSDWPPRHGCPVGRHSHLELVHASDMLNDVFAKSVTAITDSG
jgi:hypothetical protein